MERAENAVRALARDLGMESFLRLCRIQARWELVFNGPLALNTHPARLDGGRLLVNAASPAWLQQATFLKTEILRKLSGFGVSDIRFRLGRVSKKPPAPSSPPSPNSIPESYRLFIEEVVSGVGDEALCAGIRGAMEKWALKALGSDTRPGTESSPAQ